MLQAVLHYHHHGALQSLEPLQGCQRLQHKIVRDAERVKDKDIKLNSALAKLFGTCKARGIAKLHGDGYWPLFVAS